MCVNSCHSYYYNLIREESKNMQKKTNENVENLKAQVIKLKGMHNEIVEKHNELVDRKKEKTKI